MEAFVYETPEVKEVGNMQEVFLGIPEGCYSDTGMVSYICW